MSVREKLLRETLTHLEMARRTMRRLAVTDDWSARVELEDGFDEVERACLRFAEFQLGITEGTRASRDRP